MATYCAVQSPTPFMDLSREQNSSGSRAGSNRNSPLAVEGTKRVLRYCRGKSVEDGLAFVATWNAAFLESDDLHEAIGAFAGQCGVTR